MTGLIQFILSCCIIECTSPKKKEYKEEKLEWEKQQAHEQIKKLVEFQETIVAEIGKEKMEVELFKIDEEIQAEVDARWDELMELAGLNK